MDGWFRIARARAPPSPIWASLPSRDAETFRGHPSIPSSSQVTAEQMLRSPAVCLRSSFGFHGIHPDASDFRVPWTRESCEFLVSTSKKGESPPEAAKSVIHRCHAFQQTDLAVHFPQQQRAPVGGSPLTIKTGFHTPRKMRFNRERCLVTLWHEKAAFLSASTTSRQRSYARDCGLFLSLIHLSC